MKDKRITYSLISVLMFCFLLPMTVNAQTYNIGVLMSFNRLGYKSAQTQFERSLKEAGVQVNYRYENAGDDLETARSIIQSFKSDGVDLIHTYGTVATQAAAMEANDIPVLYSAVPTPVKSGIIDSMHATGSKITGTINANPIAEQVDLFQQIAPNAKVWGTIYNPDDEISAHATEAARKELESRGLTLKTATVHSIRGHQVGDAAVELLNKNIDVMFIIRDKTVASSMAAVIHRCEDKQVPVFSGNIFAVPLGAAAAMGFEYLEIGKSSAEKAEKILKDKEAIQSMYGGYALDNFTIFISPSNAKEQGVKSIPKNVLNAADRVF